MHKIGGFLIDVYLVVAKRLVYHMEFLSESDLDGRYLFCFLWIGTKGVLL